jgi:hypothetical protein
MTINEAVLASGTLAQLDDEGIRLLQDSARPHAINDVNCFITYLELRELNRLARALGWET